MRKSLRLLKRIHPMKNCPLLAALCGAWSDIWNCSRRMEDRIGTFTCQGGADPPSRWGHTCLGLWFLNPGACQVHLHCIFYIVISCACFAYLLWNHFVYPYIVSLVVLRKLFHRDDRQSTSDDYFSVFVSVNLSPWGQVFPYPTCLDWLAFLFLLSMLICF
jgi:hypothetical protein